jgi:hypothetical protein
VIGRAPSELSALKEQDLLRRFVRLSSPEDIKEFADKYGCLGDIQPLIYPDKLGQPDSLLWEGESLWFWKQEVAEMKMFVELWELIRDNQTELLKKYIIWHDQPRGVRFEWHSPSFTRHSWIDSDWLQQEQKKETQEPPVYSWEFGEVIPPALYFLCFQIEQRLRRHINLELFSLYSTEIYTPR